MSTVNLVDPMEEKKSAALILGLAIALLLFAGFRYAFGPKAQLNAMIEEIDQGQCSVEYAQDLINEYFRSLEKYEFGLAVTKSYIESCGDEYEIRAAQLGLNKKLKRWSAALSDTNSLLQKYPYDPDFGGGKERSTRNWAKINLLSSITKKL